MLKTNDLEKMLTLEEIKEKELYGKYIAIFETGERERSASYVKVGNIGIMYCLSSLGEKEIGFIPA